MGYKGANRGRRAALTILVSVLGTVFALLLAAAAYGEWLLGRIYQAPDQSQALSQDQIDAILNAEPIGTKPAEMDVLEVEHLQWEVAEKLDPEGHIFNILLLGQDRRPGEVRARTDTMILVTVNTKAETLTLTSFMRDTFVQIPGYYNNRLNVPYVFGGVELLYDTLELNFGIRPDRYVEVDFDGFEQLIDQVGGVDLYVSAGEARFINAIGGWSLGEGSHHLSGAQALAYSRNRTTGGDGDFSRTERQRKVIGALIERASQMNLVELNDLLTSAAKYVRTDMTGTELLKYVVRFYPMLSNLDSVENVRIPYGDYYYNSWAEGIGAVIVPNLEKNCAVIAEYQK